MGLGFFMRRSGPGVAVLFPTRPDSVRTGGSRPALSPRRNLMIDDDPTRRPDLSSNPYAAPQAEDPQRPFDPTFTGVTLNPWVSIWNQPRATIRQIVDTDPRYMVLPIAIAMGVSTVLSGVADSVADPAQPLALTPAVAVAISAVAGPILGLLLWLLNSWLISITARWIGGVATFTEMQAAYAWGAVPGIFTLPLSLLLVILVGQFPGRDYLGLIAINGIAEGVLGIWSFVVLCKCIGEVSRFSAWKGWGAIILAGLLLMLPIIVAGVVVVAIVASL
ncbi:Yip1 domain protein [Posidoniimonas corsicana]|uniref:Yip1 domain protein n=1 Tax=Posidoniimonas corsicana TaxID=1938618 RepID=A0A5C5UY54_9BACT|nr:Yip1 family protein [Posidoniimonas corsicana]TWT31286.1 Yip1 domain protein [Posidoniimonas corsicana]